MQNPVIDAEVHAGARSLDELLPYMESGWAERFLRAHFALPPGRIHPGGGIFAGDGEAPDAQTMAALLGDDVKAAILVPHQVMLTAGWCDTKLCGVFASALNRYLVEEWLPCDKRFRLAIGVAANDPAGAVREIERYGARPATTAVSFSPIATNIGQEHFHPIFEAAVEHGLAVIVHPSGSEGLVVGAPSLSGVGPRVSGEQWVLLPQVAAANIASLIFDGIFVRWPSLKVIFAGFGFDWVLSQMWRFEMEWRNMRLDVPWISETPWRYLENNIRFAVGDADASGTLAARIASLLPEQALIYGSNRPFLSPTDASAFDMLPDATRARISFANADETFRIT